MNTGIRRKLLLVVAACVSAPLLAAEPAGFDAAVEQTVARYQLPGIAVGVIQDGKVVYSKTTGQLESGKPDPITADTVFKIASNTKAMTAAVLARLVDQGKLKWDDPVTKYLPQFRMHDPWVTQNMQVRDLLVHNSGLGLGAGDLMLWPEPNDFKRADIIAGLAHLKPTHSFRSHYAYDNLLYVVAGEVAAAAGGKPYEQLVKQEIFAPLKLDRCQVGQWKRSEVGNVAQPHMRTAQGAKVIREDGDVVPDITSMAAGGIRCSLNDMLTWTAQWLDPARAPGWLSDTQRRAVWTPHMPMPVSKRMRDWDNSHFSAYGYGWRLSDVDGVWKVAHTGTLAGMYSSVILLPDKKVAIVILINGEGEDARAVLGEVLTKHYTAPADRKDVAYYAASIEREEAAQPDAHTVPDTTARQPAKPAQLGERLGRYRDPWFGEVALCAKGDRVEFAATRSPMLHGQVMKLGERWLVDWNDDSVDAEPWLQFAVPDSGKGMHMRLSSIDPDADFSYDYADLDFQREGRCD